MPISILLADNQALFRAGVRSLLENEADLVVTGEVSVAASVADHVQAIDPDLVVLGIDQSVVDWVEVVRSISQESLHAPVLVLCPQVDRPAITALLRAGTTGCICRDCSPAQLLDAIRTVAKDRRYLDDGIKQHLVSYYVDVLTGEHEMGPLVGVAVESAADQRPVVTKLFRPMPSQHVVRRSRLIEQLEAGHQQPLTLISAPAGYGKSTLVSSWLEGSEAASAWFSIDAQDNDPGRFLSHLVAAIRTQFADALPLTSMLIRAPRLTNMSSLIGTFVNELDSLPRRLILVLDDYHHIIDPSIHQFFVYFLRFPPQGLHLVLVSRTDPPYDLSRLRAYGRMNEVRATALKFTAEETAILMQHAIGAAVEMATAQALTERTEGWITGLQFTALAVHDGIELTDMSDVLPGEEQTLDYLIAEVLSLQPDDLQAWLLKTAIFDQFCAPLCDAVCAVSDDSEGLRLDGNSFVQWLRERNLFLIELDKEGYWFRYNHLFQMLLRNQLENALEPHEIASLHSRASHWFADQDLPQEAFDHAMLADDVMAAVKIVERYRHPIDAAGDFHVVNRWLRSLPVSVQEQRPALLMAAAWNAYSRFQLQEIPPIIEQLEVLLDDPTKESLFDPTLLGELNFFRGNLLYWLGEPDAGSAYLERARSQVSEKPISVRCEIELILSFAMHSKGQTASAIQSLNARIQQADPSQHFERAYSYGSLVFLYLMSGALTQAGQAAHHLQTAADRSSNGGLLAWGHYLLATVQLHQHDLNRASLSFSRAVQLRHLLDTRAAVDAYAGLAVTQQLLQEADAALRTMEQLQDFVQDVGEVDSLSVLHSCQARLALLDGKLTTAATWARSTCEQPSQSALFVWLEVPCMTQVRTLIAMGSKEDLRKAAKLIGRIVDVSEECRFDNQTIEATVLQALCFERQGEGQAALERLTKALSMTTPDGWLRPYVEAGQPMVEMLGRLRQQNNDMRMAITIGSILSLLPDAVSACESLMPSEPLTEREMQILRLLATDLRAKEIAVELEVSIYTVRAHIRNIYGKLDAHGRYEAVQRARDLALV